MKMGWMFIILAALGVAGICGLAVYSGDDLPPPLWAYFRYSAPSARLVDMLLGLMLLLVGLVGLIEFGTSRDARGSQFLLAMLLAAVGLGALESAFRAYVVWQGVQMAHTTNMRIVAPNMAGALMPLTLGLIIAAVASFLNAMIKAKGRKAAAA